MAKSNLLKEAIADAKAVKETALANARIALQEAFQPRVEAMLAAKLREELEDEDSLDAEMGADAGLDDVGEMGANNMGAETPDSVNVGLDFNDDGDYDLTGTVGAPIDDESDDLATDDVTAGTDALPDEMPEDDLNLDEILRELEGDMSGSNEMPEDDVNAMGHEDDDIAEIIETILRETEDLEDVPTDGDDIVKENEELKSELDEAYRVVKKLQTTINEVNLLNAKLLYTNKLFRNFELNNNQKMKVIENFDRAVSTREAKLVFATLAESFNKTKNKRTAIKEHAKPNASASRPTTSTAPSRETTQILSEGFDLANRWKKLAGLI